jgi:hypothetical protein
MWSFDADSAHWGKFSTYDLTRKTVTRFALDPSTGALTAARDSFLTLHTRELVTDIRALADGSFIGRGFLTRGDVIRFDALGREQRISGRSAPGVDTIPPKVRAHAYQSSFMPNPGRSRFAVAYRHASGLRIIDTAGSLLATADVPFRYEPQYALALRGTEPAMLIDRKHERFGYVDVASTDRHIYALFSGRTMAAYPTSSELGRFVHVFAWDGRREGIISLDVPVRSIAVDQGDSVMYAARRDPFAAIIRFDLPSGLRTPRRMPLSSHRPRQRDVQSARLVVARPSSP